MGEPGLHGAREGSEGAEDVAIGDNSLTQAARPVLTGRWPDPEHRGGEFFWGGIEGGPGACAPLTE